MSGLTLALAIAAPRVSGQAPKEPDSIVLKGAPIGGVKFEHKLHVKDRQAKCQTCHHPSKPEKALKSEYQKCTDCHTKTVAAPMKTNTRGAFHDAVAKKGTCVDCHVAEAAKGKKPPAKCPDCHKKEHA
ncbi:MAG TPA: cytochrome c3 family protein [Vicinamibacterales bacterium]|nr:cytochrome c3 family protein [Vicinamibacterales bacterium]